MNRRATMIGVAALALLCVAAERSPAQPAIAGTGVALTPAHFPRHSDADVQQMFSLGKEVGQYAVFIYPWSQEDMLPVATQVLKMSREAGLTPIVAISPTSLAGFRSEYDAPAAVRRQAGKKKLTFDDPNVREPYIAAVLELAKLKPPFLCVATEINMMAFADIKEYVRFATVYKAVYPLIKNISPETKVFVSFQWDLYQVLDQKEPRKRDEHSKLVDIFRPELDLVAFTTYPSNHFSKPSDIPATYYSDVRHHTHPDDKLMFVEVGWPTSGAKNASEDLQVQFIQRLPALMATIRPDVLLWALLHDVTGVLPSPLATTGLLSADGRRKSGFDAFKRMSGR